MYALDKMIDMGLKEGQKWPHPDYKTLAQNIALCNPRVTNRDRLIEIVQCVLKLKKSELRTITLGQLVDRFGNIF